MAEKNEIEFFHNPWEKNSYEVYHLITDQGVTDDAGLSNPFLCFLK